MRYIDMSGIHAPTQHVRTLPLTQAALQRFECSNEIEICNRIIFQWLLSWLATEWFYPGLPHMYGC